MASPQGLGYYLEWIQTRFMEVEVSKISQLMAELFRKCKRKPEQSVRDFNVEFERLVLRLYEVKCELPPLVKAWFYVDKLRLSEGEELALLSSVNNEYDVRKLQQAALIQDRSFRRPSHAAADGAASGKAAWRGKWQRHSVHVTAQAPDLTSDEDQEFLEASDFEVVEETIAAEHHTAYVAFQAAKAKYREAIKGRGTDPEELRRRSEDCLKQAKARSYCGACKRRGHWHKDPECPLRGQSTRDKATLPTPEKVQTAQLCNHVFVASGRLTERDNGIELPVTTEAPEYNEALAPPEASDVRAGRCASERHLCPGEPREA